MKIKKVEANNYRKCFEIETTKGKLSFPFAKAEVVPTSKDRLTHLSVDKELGQEWITYRLESGREGALPCDAFLEYNRDPEYLAHLMLHRLTIDALSKIEDEGISRRELSRRLRTSPSQLYRLLDPANQTKTIDQMVKLLAVLGYELEYKVVREHKRVA